MPGENNPPDPSATDGDPAGTTGDAEGLGDNGKKALENERKARRDAEKAIKALEAKVKEFEDRDKSDGEKAADRITAAEARAAKAEADLLRMTVATAKGLTPAQAKRLVGTSQEELEADADDILANFTTKPATDPKGGEGEGGGRPPSNRPTPDLRGGGDPTEEPDEMDPAKLAAFIPRP